MHEEGTAADTGLEMAGNCTLPLSEDALLRFFLVYCCFICIVGITCNVVALWCVARCPRTITPVKVILGAIFSSTLLLCLVGPPSTANLALSKLRCDGEVPKTVQMFATISVCIFTKMESIYVFVMALLRARGVWAPRRGPVRMRTAVAAVVGVGLYILLETAVMVALKWMPNIHSHSRNIRLVASKIVHYLLPVLLTLACYLSTIVAVRRNKRNLAGSQPTAAVTMVMDEATRAMLAVFISNLVFVLPCAIKFIMTTEFTKFMMDIFLVFFYTHLFVDPLVFVCFNSHHRRHVLQALQLCLGRPPREEGALTIESQVAQSSPALGVPTRGEAKTQEDTC
ncbi:uncharacterized protein LOC126987469 [Eriocheir sinensis]|uniref:uncharacterized protein LOC126987469 n=1 Tax=Eriocheir sinensis TaxID=95602 RepID=UPI0021C56796|nr:uncharacterized protein LOC126987469 [Eriocheir sinensis]